MSNTNIMNLPVAIGLDGSEYFPVVQGGTTKRAATGLLIAGGSGTSTQTANTVFAGPTSGSPATPTFRALVAADIPPSAINIAIGSTPVSGTSGLVLYNNAGTLGGYATSGSGSVAMTMSPTFVTPTLGAATATSINGLTLTASTGTLTIPNGASLIMAGAFAATLTFTALTNVTFPTSGTLATTSGASIPSVVQGDLLYGSAANVLSTLAKSTSATRYLANTGASNNPAWAQVDLTNGVTGTLPVGNGGTGQSSLTQYNLLIGNAASAVAFVAPSATVGVPLVSQGAAANPVFGTAVVAGGGTGVTSTTAYAVLCGGTTSTGALQSIASVGTANQILTSNGAGALPTFQSATTALGQALTRVDDTNVTLTLGGAPTTALLAATSITAGWTGQLALTRGGSNASLTASNGGIVYSTASAMAILSGTATANQVLLSGSSTTPAWSTATYPATTTINQLLYSSSANVVAGLATANGGMLNASSSGVPSVTVTPILGVQQTTRGQLLLANTAAGSFAATLQSSNSATAATTFTLPPDAGTSGYVLSTNGAGVTSWIAVAGTGTVTSIDVSGGTTGLTTSGGPITTSGTITLAGTLVVSNGGTGRTSLTSNVVYKGAGTSAIATSSITDDGTTVTTTLPGVSPNFASGYTTTATAAGTTTLTVASTQFQFFTGTTTQTVTLPVTSTLFTGLSYTIANNSTGVVTVNSSGANNVLVMGPQSVATFVCILTSGTSAASWSVITVYGTVPQNSQSAAYTTVLSDSGKHILHPVADNNARTFTIDSNANVPYPIGTTITFINKINVVTISITSDTLTLAGAGTTGSRSLAANGWATAVKITTTEWIISGMGLT